LIRRDSDAKWRNLPGNDVGHHVPEADESRRHEQKKPDVLPKMALIEGAFSSHVLMRSSRLTCLRLSALYRPIREPHKQITYFGEAMAVLSRHSHLSLLTPMLALTGAARSRCSSYQRHQAKIRFRLVVSALGGGGFGQPLPWGALSSLGWSEEAPRISGVTGLSTPDKSVGGSASAVYLGTAGSVG
jgi:hypothetical protein